MEFQKFNSKSQSQSEYFLLMDKIYQSTGYDFGEYKQTTIKRRFLKRLEAVNCSSYQDYINYLEGNTDEYNRLISTLLVNVTQFFRDKESWDIIKNRVLPEIITRRSLKTLTIWCVACASGEEVYSLAITLQEILGEKIKKKNIIIYGTDISKDCLRRAKEGIYKKSSLQEMDIKLIEKYFYRKSPETYQINWEIKKMTRFLKHSIIDGGQFGGFDFIVCRNLLIYFTRQLQEKVCLNLYRALKPQGLLWLGKAEKPVGQAGELLKNLYYKERIYQK
jgi:chemotaxis protein methyltransferase CheR